MNSKKTNSLYVKTDDDLTGVIVGETKTQLIVQFDGWKARFMKESGRQIGTPNRSARKVNLCEV